MKTSNRTGARAEIKIRGMVEDETLHLYVNRKYVYDRENQRGTFAPTEEVFLREARLTVPLDKQSEWGPAWEWLFDLVVVLKQARPRVIVARVEALDGCAGVLLHALARTALWELNIVVEDVRSGVGEQLMLPGVEG